jgi:hypothetical protein
MKPFKILHSITKNSKIVNMKPFKIVCMSTHCHGLLLLTRDHCMAVFDPVSSSRLFILHFKNMSNDGVKSWYHCFIPASGDATSLRIPTL